MEYITLTSVIFGIIFMAMGFFLGRAWRGNLVEDVIAHTINRLIKEGYIRAKKDSDGGIKLIKWSDAVSDEMITELYNDFKVVLKEQETDTKEG